MMNIQKILLLLFFVLLLSNTVKAEDKAIIVLFGNKNILNFEKSLKKIGIYQVETRNCTDFLFCNIEKRIPKDTKNIIFVLNRSNLQSDFPFSPLSFQWKRRISQRIWRTDTFARKLGIRLLVIGPISSPNVRIQERVRQENQWIRTVCAAKKIPYIELFHDFTDKFKDWSGFTQGKRVREKDGESLTQAGTDIVTQKIFRYLH